MLSMITWRVCARVYIYISGSIAFKWPLSQQSSVIFVHFSCYTLNFSGKKNPYSTCYNKALTYYLLKLARSQQIMNQFKQGIERASDKS